MRQLTIYFLLTTLVGCTSPPAQTVQTYPAHDAGDWAQVANGPVRATFTVNPDRLTIRDSIKNSSDQQHVVKAQCAVRMESGQTTTYSVEEDVPPGNENGQAKQVFSPTNKDIIAAIIGCGDLEVYQ